VLCHPLQQWGGEAHNALFEAGGECFVMAGNSIAHTVAQVGLSPRSLTTNRSLALTAHQAAQILRTTEPQDSTVYLQTLDTYATY
jgi:hypothetical protein